MSVKKALLSALLGLVKGGAEAYSDIGEMQHKYALEKLKAEEPTTEIKTLRSLVPNFSALPPDQKAAWGFAYRSAGGPIQYKMPPQAGTELPPKTRMASPDARFTPYEKEFNAYFKRAKKKNISDEDAAIQAHQEMKSVNSDVQEMESRFGLPLRPNAQ